MNNSFNPNPVFWQEIYTIELKPFKKMVERKCRQIIKWDDELNKLMLDPIQNGKEIEALMNKIKFISQDVDLSQNLINAVEALETSYLTHTVNLLKSCQDKENKYTVEIEKLKKSINNLSLTFVNYTEANYRLLKRRNYGS